MAHQRLTPAGKIHKPKLSKIPALSPTLIILACKMSRMKL